MSHHRRSQRHPCRLRVRLVDGPLARPAVTNDVSLQGLFVRTDEHWVANALMRLHVTDPGDPRPIPLLGIVTRSISVEEGLFGPGVGVSLFGNGDAVMARWRGLVERAGAAVAGWTSSLDAEGVTAPVRRRHTRRACDLAVQLNHGDVTHVARVRDASEGGLFLSLAALIEQGEVVHLTFEHADMPIALVGQVARCHDSLDPFEKGVGVEIDPNARSAELWGEFIKTHVPLQRALPTFLPDLPPLAKRDE